MIDLRRIGRVLKSVLGRITRVLNLMNAFFQADDLSGQKNVDILFICSDYDRALKKNGLYYSQILDPIIEKAKNDGLSVEVVSSPVSRMKSVETYSRSKRVNKSYIKYGDSVWPWLLDNCVSPKMIVGIDLTKALNKSAHKRKIHTVEVVHGFGLESDDFIWGVEARSRKSKEEEPSCFIAYDETTYHTLRSFTRDQSIKVFLARHHFYDRFQFDKDRQLQKLTSSLESRKSNYKGLILVTLQYGYEGEFDFLSNILENGLIHDSLVKVAQTKSEYLWLIKPHPVQLRRKNWQKYQTELIRLFGNYSHVICTEFLDADVFAVLSVSDLHITMMSGTTVEAAMLGVPTLGLCPTLQEGGKMYIAFREEEKQGLFHRGKLDEAVINSGIDTILLKGSNSMKRYEKKDELPSAYTFIKELIN